MPQIELLFCISQQIGFSTINCTRTKPDRFRHHISTQNVKRVRIKNPLLVLLNKQKYLQPVNRTNAWFYTIFCCTQYPIHVLYNTLKPKCSRNTFGTTSWFCVTWIDDTIVTIPCYIIIVHNELKHQLSIRSWSSQVSCKCYLHESSSAPPP